MNWKNISCDSTMDAKPLDQRKRSKLQWLEDPSEINGNNVNNVRLEVSRQFRKNKKNV
jgi:hypothetical protein